MEKEACAWEYLLSIKKEFPDKPVFLVPELLMNRVTENMRIQLSEEDIHHDLWSLTNPVNKEFDKQFRLFRALADGTTFLTDLI